MHLVVRWYCMIAGSFGLSIVNAADISFEAYGATGVELRVEVASFLSEERRDYSGRFEGGTGIGLPPGTYSYKVKAGRTRREGLVTITESNRLVVLFGEGKVANPVTGAEYHVDDGPRAMNVAGRIKGLAGRSACVKCWVRVQSIEDPEFFVDAVVGADGLFKLPFAPVGRAIVIVFSGGTPLHTRLVTGSGSSKFMVDLGRP